MAQAEPAKQLSFRLPRSLVDRLNKCVATVQAAGLDVNRADVVRLLLKHALDATQCKVERLIGRPPSSADRSSELP